MILPTDLPTRAQLERLLAVRDPSSVSLYLPTSPSSRGQAERIELKNLAGEASRQLQEAGADRGEVAAVDEELADLLDDDEFSRDQARSLALFLTPKTTVTFRLANNLAGPVEESDRFHLKPPLRAYTFPHVAFNGLDVPLLLAAVLALRREDIPGKGSVAATRRHAA